MGMEFQVETLEDMCDLMCGNHIPAKKRKNYWTQEQAKQIIDENKEYTNYFDGSMKFDDMYEMLRYRMQFGEAETAVIIASLIRSGAKFYK